MSTIIKPNWDIFKAKFSDNPQLIFQWYCYLLFCIEFRASYGIFRYKNQAAVETDPIEKDGEIIGWQAKFYETRLSEHKVDLIDAVIKCKRNHASITKLIIYTNQEWGQGQQENDPKTKIDIEKKANDMNLTLEWRTASYFESPFVTITNKDLAQYFFTFEKSIMSMLNDKQIHTESILAQIHTSIEFMGQLIEVDRTSSLDSIIKSIDTNQIYIVGGIGGVGKTAVIKKLYEYYNASIPFYLFKASEFNLTSINKLFEGFYLQDFIESHKNDKTKIVVIDSAEKLLDIENTDPLKELLFTLIDNKWTIIFTSRNNYLENLVYEFVEIYKITPLNIDIRVLSEDELIQLSDIYQFSLPNDTKVFDLIRNPFYLNEYLKVYNNNEASGYVEFKEKIWNRVIKKAKPYREQCFIGIAYERANKGLFYIIPNYDNKILQDFVEDGILGYEVTGFFIAHDIYEEWALEKFIESEFLKHQKYNQLFHAIGEALPIRRSFRNWISEKLLLSSELIKPFIEDILIDDSVKSFWKDEVLVSILLSHYSTTLFSLIKDKLLENEYSLLRKIALLLRVACKEIDNDLLRNFGVYQSKTLSLEILLTKPKGTGWASYIDFVYQNWDKLEKNSLFFIIPIIYDWNTGSKKGDTTKKASLLGLKYYQWMIGEEIYFNRREKDQEMLFETIVYGASEISPDLSSVFEQVIDNKWKHHRDPYTEFIGFILTKTGSPIFIINSLPEYVLMLAELYWEKTPSFEDRYGRTDLGQYYGIDDNNEYFPPSAYQTPIYWLLQADFTKTIDFIVTFTNKAISTFADSNLGKNEVELVDVYIGDGNFNKQYICHRIWNIYRGTQVNPHVLESMHMALEKYILERAENSRNEDLEYWLLYLLRKTKSASITALVLSVVLAYPEKSFNVAKLLFQTKEFFMYDTDRMVLDQSAKTNFSIGYGLNNRHKLHQDERIKTCDDKHRKNSLEQLAFNYQFFKGDSTTEEEASERQKVIWSIFDMFYNELSQKSTEGHGDKIWRIYLARMDRRKLKITTEERDGQLLISFDPEMDPELKEYSETSSNEISEKMKYTSLKLWAHYRLINDDKHKNYSQYDSNPTLVIHEVKDIINGINDKSTDFYLFNHSIPGNACSILVRDYYDVLSPEEKRFCKETIMNIASTSLNGPYTYQISDGVEAALSVLPLLFRDFQNDKQTILTTLLLTLCDDHPIGAYCKFAEYSIRPIIDILWLQNKEQAYSLLLGYLLIKPIYEKTRALLRKKNNYLQEYEIAQKLIKENSKLLSKIFNNEITVSDLANIEDLELYVLRNAFELFPNNTCSKEHKDLILRIISSFAKKLISYDRDDKVDFETSHGFTKKLSFILLSTNESDIDDYLRLFLVGFNGSRFYSDLFKELIIAEDKLGAYDNFWYIWNLFINKVIELCHDGDQYWYREEILQSYLFAQSYWTEGIKEWKSIKENNKVFFKRIAEKLGHCSSVLYSIVKLLNSVGYIFFNEGVSWVSNIINDNYTVLAKKKLDEYTIYHLEQYIRKFVYINRKKTIENSKLKNQVLIILDFLIENESVIGYIIRENIL